GDLTHLFPTPAAIAPADLAPLGMPRTRAATLSAVAAAALADPRLFDTADCLDNAVTRLRTLRGVGEWTAQYIALRQLREPDAFPASDIGLIRALERLENREYTPAQLLARAEAWRPWRAYAAQHLWAEY
ncbi:DNA-3-methyladenine glycosylase family protein, partial [Achromobacter xylosoxidans]